MRVFSSLISPTSCLFYLFISPSLFSLFSSLFSLGASLARFARELSETLLEERCACVPNVWPSSV